MYCVTIQFSTWQSIDALERLASSWDASLSAWAHTRTPGLGWVTAAFFADMDRPTARSLCHNANRAGLTATWASVDTPPEAAL